MKNTAFAFLILFFASCQNRQSVNNPGTQKGDPVALNSWIGTYNYYKGDGRDPVGAQIMLSLSISIRKDSCFYAGIGYQTYFKDLIHVRPENDSLYLTFVSILEGTNFHDERPELGKLYRDGEVYRFARPGLEPDTLLMEKTGL